MNNKSKKMDRLEFIKLLKVFSFKDNFKKIKRQAIDWEKYNIFKDLYPEYVKKSYRQ